MDTGFTSANVVDKQAKLLEFVLNWGVAHRTRFLVPASHRDFSLFCKNGPMAADALEQLCDRLLRQAVAV